MTIAGSRHASPLSPGTCTGRAAALTARCTESAKIVAIPYPVKRTSSGAGSHFRPARARRPATEACQLRGKLGPQARPDRRPFIPQQPTCGDCNDVSVLGQHRKWVGSFAPAPASAWRCMSIRMKERSINEILRKKHDPVRGRVRFGTWISSAAALRCCSNRRCHLADH
jgi:hypothetical protein